MDKPTKEDKPDFNKMAEEYIIGQGSNDIGMNAYPCNLSFRHGCEKIWNDYYDKLESENERLKSELDKAEDEITDLRKKLDESNVLKTRIF